MKRIIALLLVCLMLVSVLASCKKKKGDESDGESTTVATTVLNDASGKKPVTLDLPEDLTFGGQEVRILVRTSSLSYHDYVQKDAPSLVEMSVFDRNAYVKDRLDITFKFFDMNGFSSGKTEFCDAIRSSAMSEGDDYHIVVPGSYYGTSLILENIYVDLADTEYIDLEQAYWWDGFTETVKINDKVFMATGDYSVDALACMEAIFFNKTLAGQLGLDDPYKMVENGTWTMEAMLNMAEKAKLDEGNDDIYERYGLVFGFQGARCIAYSSDAFLINRNTNDVFEVTKSFDRLEGLLTTVNNAIKNNSACYYTANGDMMTMFTNGNALFMMNSFENINKLKASNVDYGILIYPKLNDAQDDYITGVSGDTVCAIINGLDDEELEMAAATLQALMYASYNYTTPAYFESTLRGQVAQDEQSYYMLERIRDTVKYDISMIYSETVKGSDYFTNCMPGGKYETVSGWYAGVGSSVEETLYDLVTHPIFK